MGPRSMGVALLTAGFVGMVFTIQVGPDPGASPRLMQKSLCTHPSGSIGGPYDMPWSLP